MKPSPEVLILIPAAKEHLCPVHILPWHEGPHFIPWQGRCQANRFLSELFVVFLNISETLGHTYKQSDFVATKVRRKWKWKSLGRVQFFCKSMDYTVCGIFPARIQDWVAFLFSRRSSQPRDWTQVSLIAGGFFTSWEIREVHKNEKHNMKSCSFYVLVCQWLVYISFTS